MRTRVWIATLAAVILALGALAGSAAALDLTGTWTGTLNCDTLVENNPRDRVLLRDQQLEIVTFGTSFAAELNSDGAVMGGVAADNGAIPTRGEAVAQHCLGSPTFNVILQLDAKVNDSTSAGTLTGELIRFVRIAPAFVTTCRANFRRTDPAPPTLSSVC